mgnify:CR=1 FL=1|jgi:hypothetical protein
MGLFSWLFGSKPKELPKPQKGKRRKVYGFDEKRSNFHAELTNLKKSDLHIKKIRIVVDKQNPDTCSAMKRMSKVYDINKTPMIPLDREKCQHCTCYYEPILPKSH